MKGCTKCFIHEEAHTNEVDLEVEGVRYIEMHHRQHTCYIGQHRSRGGDLELEGGVNVSL